MAKKRTPLHPGTFIKRVYINEIGLTQSSIAEGLGVNKGTLSRLLTGQTDVSPTMAVKLSAVLGRSAESWLNMQAAHSLAKVEAETKTWKPRLVLHGTEMARPKRRRSAGAIA